MNYFPALLFSIPTFDDIADDIEDEKPKNQCTARSNIRKEDGTLPQDGSTDWASNICREFDCDQYQCMGYTDRADARGGCIYITQYFIDNAPEGHWFKPDGTINNPMPMIGACEPIITKFMNKDPKRTGEIVIRLSDDDEDISGKPTDGEDNEPPFKDPTGRKCVGGGSNPKDGDIKKGQCVRSPQMCITGNWDYDNTCGFPPHVCCEMK
tara:strand:+ start:346 stop:975 length:630 start_codon:yes stop_codon:yes gene_type:complete